MLDDGGVHGRRNGEVVEHAFRAVDRGEPLLKRLIERRVVRLAGDVIHPVGERLRHFVSRGCRAGKFLEAVEELGSKRVVVHLAAGNADDGELGRQSAAPGETIDCGQQFALGQITGRAKDDERCRPRRWLEPKPIMKWVASHPRPIIRRLHDEPGWTSSQRRRALRIDLRRTNVDRKRDRSITCATRGTPQWRRVAPGTGVYRTMACRRADRSLPDLRSTFAASLRRSWHPRATTRGHPCRHHHR